MLAQKVQFSTIDNNIILFLFDNAIRVSVHREKYGTRKTQTNGTKVSRFVLGKKRGRRKKKGKPHSVQKD